MWGGCWQRRSNKFCPYLVAYLVGGWALDFDVGTDTFHQNITAFDFQACDVNWIYWSGYYAYVEADKLLSLDYVRCTPSGPGCVACGRSLLATRTTVESCTPTSAIDVWHPDPSAFFFS